ncbi:hypothetical protein CBR_g49951 [Chara braunii]|uniref:Uncharacterized protein n=1 Tax=Chara braunii TaxID=69332 RepID=A0A388K539_CHABU|nr:hypothetical protein CBR_g49951 [Chara braunii]|eukprot:GBG65155.1 hypothetical protein CBR_g49951 [Chara braunii]
MAATADANSQASIVRPVTPPMPVQQADETLQVFLDRLQLYSETTAAELRKWEQEEAARQQAIQRQLAEAKAARQQAAAEAAAATRLQQQQTEASQNQVRYQATTELANKEATYRRILRQQHFHANEEREEPTEEERSKEAIAVLMETVLYTCNWQQRELLAMRQIFIRYETTFRALEQKITALQTANSDQQAINDQLQTTVSTGFAPLSAVESTGSAVADCSPALAAQAKQLDERINHVVASLGDIRKFAGTSTVSNQLQTLSDRRRTYITSHHCSGLTRSTSSSLEGMTHMAVTLDCTIATLHTKISWEEFEKKWKTRFMVNNDKRHALNKIFRIFQGQQTSREWLTEWQRLVATSELNLPFDAIRAEFFARSCDGLTAALGSEFQYENFDEMISKARRTHTSRSLDEHLEHLRAILERLRIAKYKANRDKWEFAQQELEYLGHYVTPQGIRPLANEADETLQVFLDRLQLYSETTAAELRKWEQEEAARQQAIQRQLAEAKAARQQAAAEAAAATRLQQQQTEASQNQVRYQATTELANKEATYRRILRQQHFHANEEREEPTEEERSKEAIAVLMETVLYTCNWQQRELLAMRQIFIRYETTFRALEQKITALQTANSDQQAINDQLQTTVSTGFAPLSAVESTGSAVADCSPALAAQAKQLDERINHVVASLGDIRKFAGTSTVSNQLQTLSDRVQQRTAAVVKEWKMANFKIEKFDDYHKTDPL